MSARKFQKTILVIVLSLLQTNCGGPLPATVSATTSTSTGSTAGPDPNPTPDPIPSPAANPPRNSPSPGQWVNVTSNLSGMASECGNTSFVSAKPSEDLVIAGVALQGLWGTRDGGASWQKLGTGSGSAAVTNRASSIIYDPVRPEVFWESGIYNGNGIFRSDNSAGVFQSLGNIGHNDSVSVDFSDPTRQTLLAGGHEQKQMIHRSQDGGRTWINVGANLPGGTAFSSFPLVINSRTFFAGLNPSWGGGTGGIYQSNDAGATWAQASAQGGGSLPLIARDGSIYWPDGNGALMRGTGAGANWTWRQTIAAGTLANVQPVELPDGRLVSLSGQRLMISSDRGASFQAFGPALPFTPAGITYSDSDKAFYIWQFDCGNRVLPNAIMKLWL